MAWLVLTPPVAARRQRGAEALHALHAASALRPGMTLPANEPGALASCTHRWPRGAELLPVRARPRRQRRSGQLHHEVDAEEVLLDPFPQRLSRLGVESERVLGQEVRDTVAPVVPDGQLVIGRDVAELGVRLYLVARHDVFLAFGKMNPSGDAGACVVVEQAPPQ